MKNTLCLKIELTPFYPWSEILIAQLAELNFDSFEEKENVILAYGIEEEIDFSNIESSTCLSNAPFQYKISKEIIPYQNWNEKWEKEYEPIYINEMISITAPFHNPKLFKKTNVDTIVVTTGGKPVGMLDIQDMKG